MATMSELEFRTILKRMGLFESVARTSRFVVWDSGMRDHSSPRSFASMTAVSREVWEERRGV